MRTRTGLRTAVVVAGCAALTLAACSSSSKGAAPTSSTTGSPPPTQPRPSGPAADMSKELTGGNGVYMGEGSPPDLKGEGYVQREYEASGDAAAYKAVGALNEKGRWKFVTNGTAPYKTRVVVRAPADASKFSGNVMVEWLNVSGGIDANPEWASTAEEIVRSGDVWVGVSAQRIGVEGGPVLVKVTGIPGAEDAGKGLKKIDPTRYADLEHPGDAYAYDIFTQVARAVRDGAGLAGLKPRRVFAGGESQSAFALVTYYNGVQPLTHAFDGFFVHSRGGVALPLAPPGPYAVAIQNAIAGTATLFRSDQSAPIMDIQTETDVASILNSYAARQPDSDTFRLWEVAGTAHADVHLVGRKNASYLDCGVPVNDGPMHIVAKAAWHDLKQWLATGTAPPIAPRIDVKVEQGKPVIQRDSDGIALGGIRTPPVDVPVSALSGAEGPNRSVICLLLGSDKPFTDARLSQLYSSRDDYTKKFAADADRAINAGFVLAADRSALLAFAKPDVIPEVKKGPPPT
jgi:hypothetical protein